MSSPERNNETRDKNNHHHHHDNNMNNDQTHPDGKETNAVEREKGKETRQQMDKERGIELLGGSLVDCLGCQTLAQSVLGLIHNLALGRATVNNCSSIITVQRFLNDYTSNDSA